MCEKYNGAPNYATWAVNLWLHEQEQYYYWLSYARLLIVEARKEMHSEGAVRTRAFTRLGNAIKDYLNDENPLAGDSSLWVDLLANAIGKVDVNHIAYKFVDDILEEEA